MARVQFVPPSAPLSLPRRRVHPLSWVLIVAALVIGVLAGCAPEPVAEVPALACAWPHPDCCSIPPRLGVVKLRDLRAERWGR